MTQTLVLIDDPRADRRFDLVRAVGRARRVRLGAIVEPVAIGTAAGAGEPGTDGNGVAAAAAATFGAPVAIGRFTLRHPGKTPGQAAAPAEQIVASFEQGAGAPAIVAGVVSLATLPLWEALYADARARGALKIGITSPRLDLDWNLAQKLLADGKLHLHEHSATLERILGRRIDTLLSGHAGRGVPGAAGG